MTNSKKYIFYFKFSFILIIIFFIIYKLATALLSSHPSPKKDTTPVLSPTWEDCLDRLNSNPLVKDIRWDEQTKVCSVLQSVNTDNTNPNTISDSLKKCTGDCPLEKKDNKICENSQIIPRPPQPNGWWLKDFENGCENTCKEGEQTVVTIQTGPYIQGKQPGHFNFISTCVTTKDACRAAIPMIPL